MKRNKQNPDFLHIGTQLVEWFKIHGRDLPFRQTKNPYNIWICEIIFQQTRISQGINHYEKFIERFPTVFSLAEAETDEVLLYWKGLGYYSRALNLHHAAKQIIHEYKGEFPSSYDEILKLKGVGKYTAAAISSISFGQKLPAVDGNLYRVLSRFFADEKPISDSDAFQYYSELALQMMPAQEPGLYNEAMMDLGSEICTPKNPKCHECPLNRGCLACMSGTQQKFPVKKNKVLVKERTFEYYFIYSEGKFAARKRGTEDIWKNLYDLPEDIPNDFRKYQTESFQIKHKLTHRNLTIHIHLIKNLPKSNFENFCSNNNFEILSYKDSHQKSFPKPLENFIKKSYETYLNKSSSLFSDI